MNKSGRGNGINPRFDLITMLFKQSIMKKIVCSFAVAAFLLTSCNSA
ncbi:hypothetical protein EZS27_037592, partial [termite gut metagenome]